MLHTPSMCICGFATSSKPHATVETASTISGSSISFAYSSSGLCDGHEVKTSSLYCVGEDKEAMLFSNDVPKPIHPRWYKFTWGVCRSGDLSEAPTRGEEHDIRDIICLHKETLREDRLEFGDVDVVFRVLTKHERKVAKHLATTEAGDFAKVARMEGARTSVANGNRIIELLQGLCKWFSSQ